MTEKLLLGSNNPKKRNELQEILGGLGFLIVTPGEAAIDTEPVEDGDTFLENATKKALFYAGHSGLLTLADDSGLAVDALGGLPGVRSSRYAGDEATDDDNCSKLLEAMKEVPDPERTAEFRCTVVVADGEGVRAAATGKCRGMILKTKTGAGGFGYDPVFYYPPLKKSFAELPQEVKNQVSHRAAALQRIRKAFEKIRSGGSQ